MWDCRCINPHSKNPAWGTQGRSYRITFRFGSSEVQQGPAAPRGQESQEFRVILETVLPSMTGRFPQGLDLVGRSSLGSSPEQRRWGQRQF